MTVDPEGRVGVFTRARWPVMAVAWLIAVVLITLLTSRVIHVVGRQLSGTVSLPRPHAARLPAVAPPTQTALSSPKTHRQTHPPTSQQSSTSTVGVSGSGRPNLQPPATTPEA